MKIQRSFNNTSPHTLNDISLILKDLLIAEFIDKTIQSASSEINEKEVAA